MLHSCHGCDMSCLTPENVGSTRAFVISYDINPGCCAVFSVLGTPFRGTCGLRQESLRVR